ncbi:hypothetical protein HMPREF3214_00007 [Alloscardovia omnicolens]|nr:hypothetical protein HMPREF3214_00007 [Alloscardovia omnicolens]
MRSSACAPSFYGKTPVRLTTVFSSHENQASVKRGFRVCLETWA